MALFFPIASGLATVLTAALTYETYKGTQKKMERRKRKREKLNHGS